MQDSRVCPVNSGDVMDVKIVSKGKRGDGIAKVEGFTIIVSKGKRGDGIAKVEGFTIIVLGDTAIDEVVRVRITQVRPKFAFAELAE